MGLFDNIDFNNLPENYNEKDVREDIIAPLLKALGYSAFNESICIVREPRLKHPFTRFGTKNIKINIFPDYLIKVNGKNAFILEAKSPEKNIKNGENVEQAYSYAINREVQANRFVLCNGREIIIFDVDKDEPLLYFQLGKSNEENWKQLFELLSPAAFENPHIFNYKMDYGIWCMKNGIKQDCLQYFYNCYITGIFRLSESEFTILAIVKRDEELQASFDFDISLFEDFIKQVPDNLQDKVRVSLKNSPFKYVANNKEESFALKFVAYLSDDIEKNEDEVYVPLKIKEFLF